MARRWYEDGALIFEDEDDPVTASIAREIASIQSEIDSMKSAVEGL